MNIEVYQYDDAIIINMPKEGRIREYHDFDMAAEDLVRLSNYERPEGGRDIGSIPSGGEMLLTIEDQNLRWGTLTLNASGNSLLSRLIFVHDDFDPNGVY